MDFNIKNEFGKFAQDKGIGSSDMDAYQKIQASSTPYVIEERQMNMTQMDVFSRLMMDRVIWISSQVEDKMASIIQAQLLFLESLDPNRDISLYINTPGGSVLSGLGIVDTMGLIKPDIATINVGMCASMGSVLLGAGTKGKRSALRTSKVMLHQVSHGTRGNVQDTRITHIEGEKYNFMLFKLLAQYSGKPFEEVMKLSERDYWLNSEEALEFGIIDEVLPTKDGINMETLMDGFDDYLKNQFKYKK